MKLIGYAALALIWGGVTATLSAQGIEERVMQADPARGEQVFRQCQACHVLEPDGPRRVGPSLYGVVGGAKGAVEGHRYSPVLANAGGEWTLADLDAYLENPRAFLPGNRMSFRGLSDPQERADVIAYIDGFSDTPLVPTLSGEPAPAPEQQQTDLQADVGMFVPGDGAEATYFACIACHSEMIVVQQGKTRDDWDELLVWMVEEQGMAELPEDERDLILDYLAEHYNTDRPNFPRP